MLLHFLPVNLKSLALLTAGCARYCTLIPCLSKFPAHCRSFQFQKVSLSNVKVYTRYLDIMLAILNRNNFIRKKDYRSIINNTAVL